MSEVNTKKRVVHNMFRRWFQFQTFIFIAVYKANGLKNLSFYYISYDTLFCQILPINHHQSKESYKDCVEKVLQGFSFLNDWKLKFSKEVSNYW